MLIAAVCVDVVFGFVLQDFLKYDTKDREDILNVFKHRITNLSSVTFCY